MSTPYAPFDESGPEPSTSAGASSSTMPLHLRQVASTTFLESCSPLAGSTILRALELPLEGWEAEAVGLTRDEVHRRLSAAQLGGLTDAVWHGLCTSRERARSLTPVLGESTTPVALGQTPPSMARTPLMRGASAGADGLLVQQYVPDVPIMHGRVPRSQETWQYVEGEWGALSCLRAMRLATYNIWAILSVEARGKA